MSKENIKLKVSSRERELIKDCISLAKKHDKHNSSKTLNKLHNAFNELKRIKQQNQMR